MSKKLGIPFRLAVLMMLILTPALLGAQGEPVLKWHTFSDRSVMTRSPTLPLIEAGMYTWQVGAKQPGGTQSTPIPEIEMPSWRN